MPIVDLPSAQPSGLRDAVDLLEPMDDVVMVQFTNADVMRHHLVTRIVRAYEARDRNQRADRRSRSDGDPEPAERG